MTIESFSTEREESSSETEHLLEKLKERDPNSAVYEALASLPKEDLEKLDGILNEAGYNVFTFGSSRDEADRQKACDIIERVKNLKEDDKAGREAIKKDIENLLG